jgi:nicotinamide riboside transporter PnuC
MIEIISILAGLMAIAGVVLNNRRMRWCFVLWMISNAATLGIHVHSSLWGMAGRDLVFLILAVEGWFKWAVKPKAKDEK